MDPADEVLPTEDSFRSISVKYVEFFDVCTLAIDKGLQGFRRLQ
jgi:hypothetical protein